MERDWFANAGKIIMTYEEALETGK